MKGVHISREKSYTEAEVQALLHGNEGTANPAQLFEAMKPLMLDFFLPVGTVIECVDNVHPKDKYGGEWEQIKDVFTLAAGDTYTAGDTGGEATHTHPTQGHTLTVDEIPSHHHSFNYYTYQIASGSVNRRFLSYTGTGTWDSNNTGGGGSHSHGDTGSSSNMPPYLVVYKWKRIA